MPLNKLKLHNRPISRKEMSERQQKILDAYDQEVKKKQQQIEDLTSKKRQLILDNQAEVSEKEKRVNKLKIEVTDLKLQLIRKETELVREEKKP